MYNDYNDNNEITFDDINTLYLSDSQKNILFYDIFIKNNIVYLISPIYDSFITDFNDIKILYKNIELNLIKNFSSYSFEKISIRGYSLFDNEEEIINLEVEYKELKKEFKLLNYKSSYNYFLTQTTLFKHDFDLIDIFYKYYINNDVEQFYFYYNDFLNNSNPHYNKIINLTKYKKIKLIEWPFQYWDNFKGRHLCQMGQVNHALYKYGKDNSHYMIFNDLDEYIYFNKIKDYQSNQIDEYIYFNNNNNNNNNQKTLREYIIMNSKKNKHGIYLFENYWSLTLDTKVPINFPEKILKSVNSDGENHRTKCIVKTDKINLMGIHKPHHVLGTTLYNTKIDNGSLLHFCNWSNPERIVNTQYDYFKLNLIESLNYYNKNKELVLNYDFNNYKKEIKKQKTKQIILSRFNENLDYLKDNPLLFKDYDIIIYNKGPEINNEYIKERCKIINLPNVGRCEHTYLYHIIENYNNLYNFNLFLPASFYKHEKKLEIVLSILTQMINIESANIFYNYLLSKPVYEELYDFTLDEWDTTDKENKKLNILNGENNILEKSPIRPFGKWYLENIGENKSNKVSTESSSALATKRINKVNSVSFYAIFGTKKESILKYNIDFYKKLISFVDKHVHSEVCHYIERTWCSLFSD